MNIQDRLPELGARVKKLVMCSIDAGLQLLNGLRYQSAQAVSVGKDRRRILMQCLLLLLVREPGLSTFTGAEHVHRMVVACPRSLQFSLLGEHRADFLVIVDEACHQLSRRNWNLFHVDDLQLAVVDGDEAWSLYI